MDSDEVYKNRIGQRLTLLLLDAYENELITPAQASYLAGVIREELAFAKNSSDVLTFVETLASEWDIFSSLIAEPNKKSVHRRWLEEISKTP